MMIQQADALFVDIARDPWPLLSFISWNVTTPKSRHVYVCKICESYMLMSLLYGMFFIKVKTMCGHTQNTFCSSFLIFYLVPKNLKLYYLFIHGALRIFSLAKHVAHLTLILICQKDVWYTLTSLTCRAQCVTFSTL